LDLHLMAMASTTTIPRSCRRQPAISSPEPASLRELSPAFLHP
jgi:hypothetical protein